MDDFEETKASMIVGGIVGGGAGLLLGVDPVITAGCLAMTGAAAAAVAHCKDIGQPPAPAGELYAADPSDEAEIGPCTEPELSSNERRFETLVTVRQMNRNKRLR